MKIKIAAILLVTLILCSGCGFHPVMQDSSSVSQESKIETKQFVSPGIGIQFDYPSNWYVDEANVGIPCEILYSYQAGIRVYLLDQKIELQDITESLLSKTLEKKYNVDSGGGSAGRIKYSVSKTYNYEQKSNDEMQWVQMTADLLYECEGDESGIPHTVTWCFANLKNGATVLIMYVIFESGADISYQINTDAKKILNSIMCVSQPYSQSVAYEVKDFITLDE